MLAFGLCDTDTTKQYKYAQVSAMHRRRNKYKKVPTEEVDGFVDEQFQRPVPPPFPWKTVVFITGFMILGAICLAFGILISSGSLDKKYDDRAWPMLILGILMFIPGGYYGYIFICILLKRDGFTLDDIPTL